jgi:hypothetical protein
VKEIVEFGAFNPTGLPFFLSFPSPSTGSSSSAWSDGEHSHKSHQTYLIATVKIGNALTLVNAELGGKKHKFHQGFVSLGNDKKHECVSLADAIALG